MILPEKNKIYISFYPYHPGDLGSWLKHHSLVQQSTLSEKLLQDRHNNIYNYHELHLLSVPTKES